MAQSARFAMALYLQHSQERLLTRPQLKFNSE
jgi:hypothetical protein